MLAFIIVQDAALCSLHFACSWQWWKSPNQLFCSSADVCSCYQVWVWIMLLLSTTCRLKSRKMISGLIMLQDCGFVHIGISSGYSVWQIEIFHGASTLEGMASEWVLFHVVTNIFFIFILVLLCMPVQMTAQKISDKIKTVGHEAHKTDPKFNSVFFHIGLKTLTK